MVSATEIRAWAMALPEVTEKQHHLFKVSVWQVRGRTFLGIGRDQTTAVFCISEESAQAQAAADPNHSAAVNRMNAQRSFLGLEVPLAGAAAERIEARDGWAAQAPKMVIKKH